MPATDLEIGKGRGGGGLQKIFFQPLGPQFGLKIRGVPGPLPYICHSKYIMLDCSSFTIIVVERKAKLH